MLPAHLRRCRIARIYIADDDIDIRNLLTFAFLGEGHEVLPLSDGAQAVQAVTEDPPDVLVLDVMMPILDGFRVLDELENGGLRHRTRILMLTAKGSEQDRLTGLERGADFYLSKPFDTDELLSAVQFLLETSPHELEARKEREKDQSNLLLRLETVVGMQGSSDPPRP